MEVEWKKERELHLRKNNMNVEEETAGWTQRNTRFSDHRDADYRQKLILSGSVNLCPTSWSMILQCHVVTSQMSPCVIVWMIQMLHPTLCMCRRDRPHDQWRIMRPQLAALYFSHHCVVVSSLQWSLGEALVQVHASKDTNAKLDRLYNIFLCTNSITAVCIFKISSSRMLISDSS